MADFPFNGFGKHECHLLAEACRLSAENYEAEYSRAEADGESDEFAVVAYDAVELRKMAAKFEAAEIEKGKIEPWQTL